MAIDQQHKPFAYQRFGLRQPATKSVRELLLRSWIRTMVRFSTVAPVFLRLAELPLGPYKDKKLLLRYLGDRPYISPLAQVACPNLQIGRQCLIDDYVTIYAYPKAQGQVVLEDDVHLYRWTMVELGDGIGSITIGAHTYVQSGSIFNAVVNSIHIGRNCMIAARCAFMPYQHGFADCSRPMRQQPLTSRGDIIVEDDVWLGVQSCVMDGVVIGQGAIVGAGAVVTKDIPPYTVAVGAPARVIRDRREQQPELELLTLSQPHNQHELA